MDQASVAAEQLRNLPTMPREELVAVWTEHFGRAPNPALTTGLMLPVLAFRIQVRANGLSAMQLRRDSAASLQSDGFASTFRGRFKAGTRIVREWGGEIHEVQVTAAGYEYLGETYGSLSPIANRITGTRWSGPTFFGTRPKDSK